MNDEFIIYGTAKVMVSNISYDTGTQLREFLADVEGVSGVKFDSTASRYGKGGDETIDAITGIFFSPYYNCRL